MMSSTFFDNEGHVASQLKTACTTPSNVCLQLVNNVLNFYFDLYFPRAVVLANALKARNGTERFIYTTHPWLVDLYINCPANMTLSGIPLSCPSQPDVDAFKAALAAGDIVMHASPFNIQARERHYVAYSMWRSSCHADGACDAQVRAYSAGDGPSCRPPTHPSCSSAAHTARPCLTPYLPSPSAWPISWVCRFPRWPPCAM